MRPSPRKTTRIHKAAASGGAARRSPKPKPTRALSRGVGAYLSPRATFPIILSLAALSACTTVDRKAASALGTAGETATQVLSAQTAAAEATVSRLNQYWGLHDTLVCAKTRPELHATCIQGVSKTASPVLAHQIARIADALAKRKKALDALHDAYSSFVDFSQYNAGQEATAALKTSFDDINTFTSAAAALTPGGLAAVPISTTIEKGAGVGVAVYANQRQDKLILAANADLQTANQVLYVGLNQEKSVVDSLLQSLNAEQSALLQTGYDAGLISVTQILTPVFQQASPGIQLTTPSAANSDVVGAAAVIVLSSQASAQQAAASKSYDDSLSALNAVASQHERLAKGERPNLTEVEDAIADLKGDVSVMSSAAGK